MDDRAGQVRDRPEEGLDAVNSHSIEQAVYDVAGILLVPVLVAALVALALVIVEAGRVAMELHRRRARSLDDLEAAAAVARRELDDDDRPGAKRTLRAVAWSTSMLDVFDRLVDDWGHAGWDDRSAKVLADFDYGSLRRLERTRILVRAGPALGLMGTLIPLSPALAALAKGDVAKLADDLRIAFSVTILGLFVGAVAFGVSLVRDRIYAQDLSDIEYVIAALAWSPPGPDDGLDVLTSLEGDW
jgi:biopolymer transport protein ExbB/TolQ